MILILAIGAVSASEIDDKNSQLDDLNNFGYNSINPSNDVNLDYSQNEIGVYALNDNDDSIIKEKLDEDSSSNKQLVNDNVVKDVNNSQNNTNNTNNTNNKSKIISSKYNFAESGKVTLNQVKTSASSLKSYIAEYYRLPKYVNVGKYNVTVSQFSYLMACAIKNINAKHLSYKINIIPIKASEIEGDVIINSIYYTKYLAWANKIVSNGKNSNKINSYISFDSKKLAFKDYTNSFAKILSYYKSHKKLPRSLSVETFVMNKKKVILLGSNSLGKVELIGLLEIQVLKLK